MQPLRQAPWAIYEEWIPFQLFRLIRACTHAENQQKHENRRQKCESRCQNNVSRSILHISSSPGHCPWFTQHGRRSGDHRQDMPMLLLRIPDGDWLAVKMLSLCTRSGCACFMTQTAVAMSGCVPVRQARFAGAGRSAVTRMDSNQLPDARSRQSTQIQTELVRSASVGRRHTCSVFRGPGKERVCCEPLRPGRIGPSRSIPPGDSAISPALSVCPECRLQSLLFSGSLLCSAGVKCATSAGVQWPLYAS
jgi:hypothetical protein